MANWVWVYVGIGLGGLAMVICFGISLWRKSQALLGEVGVLLERADEVAALLSQIEVPADADSGDHPRPGTKMRSTTSTTT